MYDLYMESIDNQMVIVMYAEKKNQGAGVAP